MSLRRLTLIVVIGLIVFGVGALFATCTYTGQKWLAEREGDTPKDALSTYGAAVARGDEEAALASWASPNHVGADSVDEEIAIRRLSLTRHLIESGAIIPEQFGDQRRWSGSCAPQTVTARVGSLEDELDCSYLATIDVVDRAGSSMAYTFRLTARNRDPLWLGWPAREWELVDVFPATQHPEYLLRLTDPRR